jgi:general nucleoside transport system permease protein
VNTAVAVLAGGVLLMAPVLWATLGELVVEQSGVLNIGVEGVMLLAAFAAAWGYKATGSLYVGISWAIGAGLACGIVLSLFYVRLGADQVVTGIMFNVFALGLTTTLYSRYLGTNVATTLPDVRIPGLGNIPWVGDVFFHQNILVYAAILTAPVVLYLLQHTWFGLYVRASGELPRAVESVGLDVWKIRYPAVILACILTALGGATLVASTTGGFVIGITAGRGFLALAVVVLSRWNPLVAILGALLFGVAQSLQFQAASLGPLERVPSDFILMFPYVVTILAVAFARGSRYPAACAVPYVPSRVASRGRLQRATPGTGALVGRE